MRKIILPATVLVWTTVFLAGVLDPLNIESDDPTIAFEDCARWEQAISRYVEIGAVGSSVHRFDFLHGHDDFSFYPEEPSWLTGRLDAKRQKSTRLR